jgi:hypothetical protein
MPVYLAPFHRVGVAGSSLRLRQGLPLILKQDRPARIRSCLATNVFWPASMDF